MTGCASKQESHKPKRESLKAKSARINPGQSKEDIMAILGPPGNRQFNMQQEAWQYCSTGFSADYFLVVWFNQGIVTGMKTYSIYDQFGHCSSFYREVNWVTP